MAKAFITVGTSFNEALCWDFSDFWIGGIPEPLGCAGTRAGEPEVREHRYNMLDYTGKISDAESFLGVFRKTEQLWRYPAEIDTLLSYEKAAPEQFDSIKIIQFIHEKSEVGNLAVSVLKGLVERLWPERFIFSRPVEFPELPKGRSEKIGSIPDAIVTGITQDLDEENVFFLTGGYKLQLIAVMEAFSSSDLNNRIIYKHEDSGIVEHYKDIDPFYYVI